MNKKKICIIILCIFIVWIMMGITDFTLVHHYHKPVFCMGINLADDGGSGRYVGLGYSFYIEGNFLPESQYPGVTSYRGYILSKEVSHGFWEIMLP